MNTVLVVGSGGREHVLAWKLAQSPQVKRILVAPGNPGMPTSWERWPVSLSGGKPEFEKLALRAVAEKIDLVVVGPDNALADGIVDVFESHGIRMMGPTSKAAQIEASKSFAKEVMKAAAVPTAQYWIANSFEEARKILKSIPWTAHRGWVVKADGLALGKGVRVCESQSDALEAAEELISLSGKILIEEKLFGEEISWMAFCDGENCALLEPARDYKRLLDGDQGPNTGGMGAFSPVPGIPKNWAERIQREVFLPTLRELKRRDCEFRGLLYAGLMADFSTDRYWVLEFNSRFGDPEAQVLVPRIDADLFTWCCAVADGNISHLPNSVPFKKETAVFVVAAAPGYPAQPLTGSSIQVGPNPSFFFAGVGSKGDQLFTSGGRVFGSLGLGEDLEKARQNAYQSLGNSAFEGMQFRSDIGRIIGHSK